MDGVGLGCELGGKDAADLCEGCWDVEDNFFHFCFLLFYFVLSEKL